MSDKKIKCCKVRKCKWSGLESELISVKNKKETKKYGCEISDNVCPDCGNKEFYVVDDNDGKS